MGRKREGEHPARCNCSFCKIETQVHKRMVYLHSPIKHLRSYRWNWTDALAGATSTGRLYALHALRTTGALMDWFRAKGCNGNHHTRCVHVVIDNKSLCGNPKDKDVKWIPWKTSNEKRKCGHCKNHINNQANTKISWMATSPRNAPIAIVKCGMTPWRDILYAGTAANIGSQLSASRTYSGQEMKPYHDDIRFKEHQAQSFWDKKAEEKTKTAKNQNSLIHTITY